MKRKCKYITIIFLALISLYSCDKNLDINPTKELESDYFSDEERLQRGIIAVYAKLTDLYSYNANAPMHKLWLLPGDDMRSNNPRSADTFKGLAGNDADIQNVWNRLYQLITRANTMLQKIEEKGSVYTTPGMKDYNTGELLFLRSWAFYKLWTWWGKAPIVTERAIGLENIYPSPSTGMEMLDKAIADLELAATLLPESWPTAESGRINRDAAYGLLVKSYVTRACYNNKNVDDYTKAIASFGKISSNKKLTKHFGENFDYRFENNSESLFEFQASLKTAENPWLDNDFSDAVGSMGAFYKHFLNVNQNQGALVGPTRKLVDAFNPADPRIAETYTKTNIGAWSFAGGFMMVKYVNGDRNLFAGIGTINSINNTRILRLADVKLLVAEAYLQTNQADKALLQVNDIRTRARISTPSGAEATEPANLTSVTMQDIIDERLRELAGEEGIRWNDLRRWHVAGYIDMSTWTKTDFGFLPSYDDNLWGFNVQTHLLMPIPNSEMNTNPKMLESGQNPGY